MDTETTFVLLFLVATAVAIAARHVRLPYTVALVLAGLALGALAVFPAPHLTESLLFSIFLPGLVFEAAFHIDSREFGDSWLSIVTFAVPGVVASTALIAFTLPPVVHLLHLVPGFGWKNALIFGALISATDPVAVVALFRSMGAPRRLTMLLDGESLLNDGTAIVFFTLSLTLVSGTDIGIGHIGVQFLSVVGIGAVIGMIIGMAASLVMQHVDDPMIEITLTTIAAYGSFAMAQTAGASGVIATVAAGMLCGNYGARTGMSASTRVASATFWEYVVFALNSIVFLLIGLEVHPSMLLQYWLPIVVAYLVVTLGRGVVIFAGRALLGFTRERFPWRWSLVLTWGGLRGALPMVLALSLPASFAYRDLIVSMTFGVALLSILVHGVTMSPLLRLLGIVDPLIERTDYEIRIGRVQAAAAALSELDRMANARLVPPVILDGLREDYRQQIEHAEEELKNLTVSDQQLYSRDLYRIRRRLLAAERAQVMHSFAQGALGRRSQEQLLADIDARLVSLESGNERDDNAPQTMPGVDNPPERSGRS
ncbi:MAG: Na+/H+ antiporter [Steroidobacteraceae bacterium]